jgi:two-component system phosphate regulon sensor histidine kinase PhoR
MSKHTANSDQLKKQYAQLEEHYRRLVESISEGVAVTSVEGIITSVSPAIERLTGWSQEELIGSSFQTLIHPADLPLVMEGKQQLQNGHKFPPISVRLLEKSGDYRPVELSSQPEIEDGHVVGIWTLTRDMTLDIEAAEQQEALLDEKRTVQNLMDLIQAASRRVRSPLTLINLTASRLSTHIQNPAAHSSLELIETYVQNLTNLVERVLTMAELDANRAHFSFSAIQLNDLLDYIQTYFKALADSRRITFVVQPTPALPPVRACQYNLYRAMQEVVANALQYTPEAGTVTLRTFQKDSGGVIEVRDTGPGIPPERIPHLFERFYHFSASDADTDRMGLGLPLAKKIIDRHGGSIEVTSTPGEGSVVTITIPFYKP